MYFHLQSFAEAGHRLVVILILINLSQLFLSVTGWNAGTKLLNLDVPNTLPNAELKPQMNESIEFGADLQVLPRQGKTRCNLL